MARSAWGTSTNCDTAVTDDNPKPSRPPGSNDILGLWKLVVYVFLALLVVVTVASMLDQVFDDHQFQVDAGFYTLVGGMIAGLFSAQVIASLIDRGRNGK